MVAAVITVMVVVAAVVVEIVIVVVVVRGKMKISGMKKEKEGMCPEGYHQTMRWLIFVQCGKTPDILTYHCAQKDNMSPYALLGN